LGGSFESKFLKVCIQEGGGPTKDGRVEGLLGDGTGPSKGKDGGCLISYPNERNRNQPNFYLEYTLELEKRELSVWTNRSKVF